MIVINKDTQVLETEVFRDLKIPQDALDEERNKLVTAFGAKLIDILRRDRDLRDDEKIRDSYNGLMKTMYRDIESYRPKDIRNCLKLVEWNIRKIEALDWLEDYLCELEEIEDASYRVEIKRKKFYYMKRKIRSNRAMFWSRIQEDEAI